MNAHAMIDHVSLGTQRFAQAIAFYETCLFRSGLRATAPDGKGGCIRRGREMGVLALSQRRRRTPSLEHEVTWPLRRILVRRCCDSLMSAMGKGATVIRPPGERAEIGPDYFGTVIRDLEPATRLRAWAEPSWSHGGPGISAELNEAPGVTGQGGQSVRLLAPPAP
jgi:hypothetical protein